MNLELIRFWSLIDRRCTFQYPSLSLYSGMFRVSVFPGASKRYKIRRVEYPWLRFMRSSAWKSLHGEMIEYFRNRKPARSSTVTVRAQTWPRFASKEQLISQGYVPGIIWKNGDERRIILERNDIEKIAFDDVGENSHLSNLFKARILRIHIENEPPEVCVVSDASAHVNNRELHFVKFSRHVPGKVTAVELPITLTGLLACPATLQGAQVDLAIPCVKVECIGDEIPPPILLDVSHLRFEPPYSKITLGDIEKLLPQDGKTRLSREYTRRDRIEKEIVLCYEIKGIEERALPTDYQDPNFFNRQGKKYHVTYSGFWPRQ